MSGDSLVIDTNIVIYHLKGDTTLESLLQDKNIYLSFVSEIELKSFKKLSRQETTLIHKFISFTTIIHSNDLISQLAISLRKESALKIPDALIVSTALYLNLPLLTADKRLTTISPLELIQYDPGLL